MVLYVGNLKFFFFTKSCNFFYDENIHGFLAANKGEGGTIRAVTFTQVLLSALFVE